MDDANPLAEAVYKHHQKLWRSPHGQEGRVLPLDLLEGWQVDTLGSALLLAPQLNGPEKKRLLFLVDSCLRSDYPEASRDVAYTEIATKLK